MAVKTHSPVQVRQPKRLNLYEKLLGQIVVGKYAPGEKLIESKIAEKFKVSRTPVREILFQLVQNELVGYQANCGFFVLPLNEKEIQELYPILWTLESLALRTTSKLIATSLDKLRQINSDLLKSIKNPTRALSIDADWHKVLIEHCTNHRLKQTIQLIKQKLKRFDYTYMEQSGLIPISVKQHDNIIKAVERNDIDTAVKHLESNWQIGLEWKLKELRQN